MSELAADYAAVDRARDRCASVAESLNNEHRELDDMVTSLLAGDWTGAAAGEFRQAFGDWSHGARTVLDGLRAASVLIDDVKHTLQSQDDTVGVTMARLQGRLG